jgi:hypothetical protein
MNRRSWLHAPILAALLVAVLAFAFPQAVSVVHAEASLQLPRATVPQGATVAINGSGFTSPDTATVYFNASVNGHQSRLQTTAVVNGNGQFSAQLNLPRGVAAGSYTVTATDAHGVSATTRLRILPLLVIRTGAPTASATVIAHSGFYINALGFSPNETVRIQATFHTYSGNDVVVTRTRTANAQGNVFGITMTPPNGAKIGYATVNAAGGSSNKQAPGRVYLVYRAYITLKHSSATVGTAVGVVGHAFVSYSDVRVEITINSSGGQQTLSVTASTDVNGNFTKYITIPSYAAPGNYNVVATSVSTGLKHYAKVSVLARAARPTPKPTAQPTAKPTATATPQPTPRALHSVLSVLPRKTLPNQPISFVGTGFPANATVNVSVTVDLRGGGNRALSKTVFADSNGNFSTSIQIPYKAAQGTYYVVASAGRARASGQVLVLPFSAHPSNLNFRWTSLWYHTVRHGTYDVIKIQSTLQTTLGIWAHVIFPSGQRYDYYTNTNSSGLWSVKFTIPNSAISRHSNQAYITLQLWHGQQTTQAFLDFTLV